MTSRSHQSTRPRIAFAALALLTLIIVIVYLYPRTAATGPNGATGTRSVTQFASGEQRVALVELFTSEGCSSCPPADRWLSRFSTDDRLWREVVPIAFHVDYWDYLGWPDRFARADFSGRQRQYARLGNISQVYTPGLVVAGREWRGWYRGGSLRPDPTVVGKLELHPGAKGLTASFTPAGTAVSAGAIQLNVVLLGFDLSTEVGGGENGGKTLRHDFVALAHHVWPMRRGEQAWQLDTDFATIRAAASAAHPGRLGLAAWVSNGSDQTPIQATGGWLE